MCTNSKKLARRSTLYRILPHTARTARQADEEYQRGARAKVSGELDGLSDDPGRGGTLRGRFGSLLDTKSVILIIPKHHKSVGDHETK